MPITDYDLMLADMVPVTIDLRDKMVENERRYIEERDARWNDTVADIVGQDPF